MSRETRHGPRLRRSLGIIRGRDEDTIHPEAVEAEHAAETNDEHRRIELLLAPHDNPESAYQLGIAYLAGSYGISQCVNDAEQHLLRAIKLGHPLAPQALAYFYYKGVHGFPQIYAEAARLYRLSADCGSAEAQYMLGTMLLRGKKGVKRDPKSAAHYLWMAGNQGVDDAKVKIGKMLERRQLDSVSMGKVVKYLTMAADHNCVFAASILGSMYHEGKEVTRSPHRAIKYLKVASDGGHICSQFLLANIYVTNRGSRRNVKEAERYFKLAADGGSSEANVRLAEIYKGSFGDELRDMAKFMEHCQRAAGQNCPIGRYQLGLACMTGDGSALSLMDGIDHIEMAANGGCADAQNKYGEILTQGRGEIKDFERASIYFRKAVRQGHVEAKLNLARLILRDWGQLERPDEAIELLEESAERDHVGALMFLGDFHRIGKWSTEDYLSRIRKAEKYYQQASSLGSAEAKVKLGHIYRDDYLTPESNGIAVQHFRQAAEKGNIEAHIALGHIFRDIRPGSEENKIAFGHFKIAAASGNAEGQLNAGRMVLKGIGTMKDESAAKKYFRAASEQGCTEACIFLGHIHRFGWGVKKNVELARSYYARSSENKNLVGRIHFKKLKPCVSSSSAKKPHSISLPKVRLFLCSYWKIEYLLWGMNGKDGVNEVKAQQVVEHWMNESPSMASNPIMEAFRAAMLDPTFFNEKETNSDEERSKSSWKNAIHLGLIEQAKGENNWALVFVSWMHYCGIEMTVDFKESFRLAQTAADNGNSAAQRHIGMLHYRGHGTPRNLELATKYLTLSADQGNARAQVDLGCLHREYEARDYGQAFNLFKAAADQKLRLACVYLGEMYQHGYGVNMDFEEAMVQYKLAEKFGVPRGIHRIGQLYLSGKGVKECKKTAKDLFKKAEELGHIDSSHKLGEICESEGHCDDALEHYDRAIVHGHLSCLKAAVRLVGCGWRIKQDKSKAMCCLHLAAQKSDADSQTNLGFKHEHGIGVHPNGGEYVKLYERAAEKCEIARLRLGLMYRDDDDDEQRAKQLLNSVAEDGDTTAKAYLSRNSMSDFGRRNALSNEYRRSVADEAFHTLDSFFRQFE